MTDTILFHTFPNGLVLVAEPMPSLQSAAFTFLVPAGCVHDPTGRGGLAGFVLEMVLRGAGPRDNRRLVLDLDNLGVERSESVSDAHAYFGGVTLSENLPAALAIYADVLRRPHLPGDQLEMVRQIMLQDIQAVEDEPAQKLGNELRRRYYHAPWGRPSQGELAAVEATTLDDIRAFFADRFRAGGTVLGVAGRFDWESLKATVADLLADWPNGGESPLPGAVARPTTGHVAHESQQTQIGIAWPCVPYRDDRYFEAWGAVGVLSGGMSSRLFTEVRERRGLCYSIHAACHSLREHGGVFCHAGTTTDRAQETLDVTLAEIRRLAAGVETHELERLKARIKSALIMQQESSASRSSGIARDWHHLGRVRTLDEVGRRIDRLSCESINAYLEANPPRDFTVVTLGTDPLETPR
ncbi:MAG TPA: pitrilysin family protein [Thermoguttaceae bacterium]|nr:pitrilysin family protein [Thermoguttaceae bacterium]